MKKILTALTIFLFAASLISCKSYDKYTKEEAYSKAKNEMNHINSLDIVNNGLEIYSVDNELEFDSFITSTTIKNNTGIYISEREGISDKAIYAWNHETYKEFINDVLVTEKQMEKDFFEEKYLGVQRLTLDSSKVNEYDFNVYETTHAWGGKSLYIEHLISFESNFSLSLIYLNKEYTIYDIEINLWTGIWKGSMTVLGSYYEDSILKRVKYFVYTNTSFSESEYLENPYYVW